MAGYAARLRLPTGNLYQGFFPNEEILLYPMTTDEEKFFSAASITFRETINILSKSRIKPFPKGFDPMDFTTDDRFFILWNIRLISWGPYWYTYYVCGGRNCKEGKTLINMRDVKVRYLSDLLETVPDEEGKIHPVDPFTVKLPWTGDEIVWRLLTGHDEEGVEKTILDLKEKVPDPEKLGDVDAQFRLARRLVSVNGKMLSPGDKLMYVKELEGADSLTYRMAVKKFDVGLDIKHSMICANCGHNNGTRAFPVTDEFFRPEFVGFVHPTTGEIVGRDDLLEKVVGDRVEKHPGDASVGEEVLAEKVPKANRVGQ